MDRSVIDTWRAEEKDLSDILYKKLDILMIMHPPSEEFRTVFTEDMFLKPNPKAFFHVMHYLFLLLDPTEFKKRFYWPISDKKSETYFRSSTVEYLNYLNEKHNLNWKQLTNYLVVMPGGVKFITFLIDIIDFIVNELIKRTEKVVFDQSGKKNRESTKLNMEKLNIENEYFKTHYSCYVEQIDEACAVYKKNTCRLKLKLDELAKNQGISIDQLMDPSFLKQWENINWEAFQSEFRNKWENLNNFINPLNKLKEKTELILSRKSEIFYDKDSLLRSYNLIQTTNPTDNQLVLFPKNELSFEELIKAFNLIVPTVDKKLSGMQQTNIEKWEFESNEMEKLTQELTELKSEMLKFNDSLESAKAAQVKKSQMQVKSSLPDNLRTKFINTPPITFDIEHSRVKKPRLPLLDDYISQTDSFSFANQTTLLQPRSAKRDFFRSTGKCKSKMFNPHAMLETVKKSKNTHKACSSSLSALALKWKERESMLDSEVVLPTIKVSPARSAVLLKTKEPPVTAGCSGIKQKKNTLIERVIETRAVLSPDGITYQKRNIGSPLVNDNLDFIKVSTSPSGRLESLVPMDNINIPKISLNDVLIMKKEPGEEIVDYVPANKSIRELKIN